MDMDTHGDLFADIIDGDDLDELAFLDDVRINLTEESHETSSIVSHAILANPQLAHESEKTMSSVEPPVMLVHQLARDIPLLTPSILQNETITLLAENVMKAIAKIQGPSAKHTAPIIPEAPELPSIDKISPYDSIEPGEIVSDPEDNTADACTKIKSNKCRHAEDFRFQFDNSSDIYLAQPSQAYGSDFSEYARCVVKKWQRVKKLGGDIDAANSDDSAVSLSSMKTVKCLSLPVNRACQPHACHASSRLENQPLTCPLPNSLASDHLSKSPTPTTLLRQLPGTFSIQKQKKKRLWNKNQKEKRKKENNQDVPVICAPKPKRKCRKLKSTNLRCLPSSCPSSPQNSSQLKSSNPQMNVCRPWSTSLRSKNKHSDSDRSIHERYESLSLLPGELSRSQSQSKSKLSSLKDCSISPPKSRSRKRYAAESFSISDNKMPLSKSPATFCPVPALSSSKKRKKRKRKRRRKLEEKNQDPKWHMVPVELPESSPSRSTILISLSSSRESSPLKINSRSTTSSCLSISLDKNLRPESTLSNHSKTPIRERCKSAAHSPPKLPRSRSRSITSQLRSESKLSNNSSSIRQKCKSHSRSPLTPPRSQSRSTKSRSRSKSKRSNSSSVRRKPRSQSSSPRRLSRSRSSSKRRRSNSLEKIYKTRSRSPQLRSTIRRFRSRRRLPTRSRSISRSRSRGSSRRTSSDRAYKRRYRSRSSVRNRRRSYSRYKRPRSRSPRRLRSLRTSPVQTALQHPKPLPNTSEINAMAIYSQQITQCIPIVNTQPVSFQGAVSGYNTMQDNGYFACPQNVIPYSFEHIPYPAPAPAQYQPYSYAPHPLFNAATSNQNVAQPYYHLGANTNTYPYQHVLGPKPVPSLPACDDAKKLSPFVTRLKHLSFVREKRQADTIDSKRVRKSSVIDVDLISELYGDLSSSPVYLEDGQSRNNVLTSTVTKSKTPNESELQASSDDDFVTKPPVLIRNRKPGVKPVRERIVVNLLCNKKSSETNNLKSTHLLEKDQKRSESNQGNYKPSSEMIVNSDNSYDKFEFSSKFDLLSTSQSFVNSEDSCLTRESVESHELKDDTHNPKLNSNEVSSVPNESMINSGSDNLVESNYNLTIDIQSPSTSALLLERLRNVLFVNKRSVLTQVDFIQMDLRGTVDVVETCENIQIRQLFNDLSSVLK